MSRGLRERAHLQEWVIVHPEVLGEDLLVVTVEYDSWRGVDGVGAKDRLDVLAIEPSGRLVVAELKRDEDRDVLRTATRNRVPASEHEQAL